jgi:hypothetical protein
MHYQNINKMKKTNYLLYAGLAGAALFLFFRSKASSKRGSIEISPSEKMSEDEFNKAVTSGNEDRRLSVRSKESQLNTLPGYRQRSERQKMLGY